MLGFGQSVSNGNALRRLRSILNFEVGIKFNIFYNFSYLYYANLFPLGTQTTVQHETSISAYMEHAPDIFFVFIVGPVAGGP